LEAHDLNLSRPRIPANIDMEVRVILEVESHVIIRERAREPPGICNLYDKKIPRFSLLYKGELRGK
jgi:hypothetical protein